MTEKRGCRVRLPDDFVVPPRFTSTLMTRRGGEHFEVEVVMRGGKPHAKRIEITPSGNQRDISVEELRKIDLANVLVEALRNEMVYEWPTFQAATNEDEWKPLVARAERVARTAGRRRITPELLDQVLALHAEGGIGKVMDELGYTERNARRLLKRAREAGQ
jgi:hypothetical protein